jgi:dTDP-4-amino-4,6-dideoxygalactose transaminase
LERVMNRLRSSYDRGILTNGPLVSELEAATAARLGVDHVVAVGNCTSGLILTLRALDLDGTVVLPSFTFSASAHAVAWNALTPLFVECDPKSLQVDVDHAEARAESVDGAAAVLATHVFGAPAPVEALEALADRLGVPLVFDAAHALGAEHGGRPVGGNGVAEVFSLSPTKPVVAGEGGLVATNRADVAASLRIGRDYGNPGNYDTQFVGLNARLSELHAAVALESLAELDENLRTRNRLATRYRRGMATIPGVTVQHVEEGDRSTFKDLTVLVDSATFGLARDDIVAALARDGIDTRLYFSPPVHRHTAYAHLRADDLPVTDVASGRVMSLPFFTAMTDDDVDRVVECVAALQSHADQIQPGLASA